MAQLTVKQYLTAAFAPNTLRAYQADLAHFREWGGRIPATPASVAKYLASQAGILSASTLSRRVVAISHAHQQRNFASPTAHPLVRSTMKGIRRLHRRPVRQVDALRKTDVITIVKHALGDLRGLRDAALLLLGFAGAFRRSELVGLNVSDLEISEAGTLVHLRHSKTDQEGLGRDVAVPRQRGRFCPTRILERWLASADIQEGPVFRRMLSTGEVSAHRLSAQSVGLIVKRRVSEIGLDAARFSGHSLRAGFVTMAAERGVSATWIRQQTGHKSDEMTQRYVRRSSMFRNNPLTQSW